MNIKTGSQLPYAEFFYLDKKNEVKKINTSDLFKNQKVILLGMPGAFTKTCSAIHLPSFVNSYEEAKKKGVTKIVCVSVNDPNVMKAWGESQKVENKIIMLGDPFCKFTKLIGAEVDKSAKGLGMRSNRYTMLVENEVVKLLKVEKETATCELSAAENFLKMM